jgi:ferrous iron transport protein A
MRPLSTLIPGERAVVARIDIPPDQRGRLMEMGLLPGTSVELVRFAPLGDPVEIKLRNYHLSLRKLEAEKIQVH